jgi:phosphoglycolate phosphatase
MLYYRGHLLDNTFVYPGILDVLSALRASGRFRMAVLSNKPVGPSRRICEGLGLAEFMTIIYGGNSFSTKKPDPEGAHALLAESGVRPEEAIMIGDSQNDVLTANNSGMFSIGVTYGLSPESLKIHKPDVLVDSAAELLTVLGLG